jgi:aldose 1-epimerase
MTIQQEPFGTLPDGRSADLFTLDNRRGLVAKITNYGGRITQLDAPDAHGRTAPIVLGFAQFEKYLKRNPYFGSIVGRYANRIAKGRFSIDGVPYQIPPNNGDNALHGGPVGFDQVLWRASPSNPNGVPTLRLAYDSPEGDQGFPGNCQVRVTYSLNERDELRIDYVATTDQPTIINLSSHVYFNLAGAGSGDVMRHRALIHADRYTPTNDDLIPTGAIDSVRGTALDFSTAHLVGDRIGQISNGYDHNFVLNAGAPFAAQVVEETAGRGIEVTTDQPGVQFYTGGFLDGSHEGIGGKYNRFGGFCLETQHFPDSPNHANFPSTILRAGETFASSTICRFFTT